MYKIVLIRHGESQWNKENRFTGWHDVDLSEKGREEARKGGQTLKKEGYVFDVAFTSVLKRAIRTLWTVLDEMDLMWIPVNRTWRLNERHYGNLTGLNKAETAAQHGEEQAKIWRRSFDIPPPALEPTDPRYPANDPRYTSLDPRVLPATESLKTTIDRVLPYWHDTIVPSIRAGKRVIIEEADRLRNLVDRMLGSNKLPALSPTNIHEVLERVCSLVDLESQGSITLVRDYDPSIPELLVDREQMIQAVLNIVRNAMQALASQPEQRLGRITLRTRSLRQFTIGHTRHRLVCKVEIIDNGPGIPAELQETLFYPMVSGRADGTGLGLAITQTIISQHQGLIECESHPGHTLFSIFLPLEQGAAPS